MPSTENAQTHPLHYFLESNILELEKKSPRNNASIYFILSVKKLDLKSVLEQSTIKASWSESEDSAKKANDAFKSTFKTSVFPAVMTSSW